MFHIRQQWASANYKIIHNNNCYNNKTVQHLKAFGWKLWCCCAQKSLSAERCVALSVNVSQTQNRRCSLLMAVTYTEVGGVSPRFSALLCERCVQRQTVCNHLTMRQLLWMKYVGALPLSSPSCDLDLPLNALRQDSKFPHKEFRLYLFSLSQNLKLCLMGAWKERTLDFELSLKTSDLSF